MSKTLDVLALVAVLAGLLLVATPGTAPVGVALLAGGAYGLILPEFIEPRGPATS